MRRRLLVLAPFPPRHDGTHGGAVSVARLLDLHATRQKVALIALRRPWEDGVDEQVRGVCEHVVEVDHVPVGRSPRVAWRERGRLAAFARGEPLWAASTHASAYVRELDRLSASWRPDVVQAELGVMAQYLRHAPPTARRVLVEHDPLTRRSSGALARLARRSFLGRAVNAADAVVVFSRTDAREVAAHARGRVAIHEIPLAWRIGRPASDPVGADPPTVLFVGSFRHPPNVDAARRLEALLPTLRRQVSDVRLVLVGEAPPRGLGSGGAVVPGRVPDLAPWLETAAVVAAPLHEGGGMRLKVLDALEAGKALVGTHRAFEGLSLVDGRDVVVADDDEALAAALVELLRDPEARARLGRAARSWAARLPTAAEIAEAYDAVYRGLERG